MSERDYISHRSCSGYFFVQKGRIYLRTSEPLHIVKKDHAGTPGIFIYDDDVALMKQIFYHRTMRAVSIHELMNELQGGHKSTIAISKRLGKLTRSRLLVQIKQPTAGRYTHYHYKLGLRGIEVLSQVDPQFFSQIDDLKSFVSSATVPSAHTAAASTIANWVYMACLKDAVLKGCSHSRGSSHDLFKQSPAEGLLPPIVPDWIFEHRDTVVCVEVDTGSQRQQTILSKYRRYIEMAESFQEKNKKLVVVFSVVDETVDVAFSDNRQRRNAYLKELAPPVQEWGDCSDGEDPGISFYVVSAKRTPPLIRELLAGFLPFTKRARYQNAKDWMKKAEHVFKEAYSFSMVENDSFFNPRRDRSMDSDLVLRMERNALDGRNRLFAVIYGEEGSVLTHQLIKTTALRLSQLERDRRSNAPELLVCYDDIENVENDAHGIEIPCRVTELAYGEWLAAQREDSAPPQVMEVVSPFKKEWREFDE